MKKLLPVIFASFALLFLVSGIANASACYPTHTTTGYDNVDPASPFHTSKDPLKNAVVQCGQFPDCKCDVADFFTMVRRVYIIILWTFAVPLAGLLVVFGGVLMVLSGINGSFYDWGKTVLWGAAWGLGLIFGSWLIINIVFMAFGYAGSWFSF